MSDFQFVYGSQYYNHSNNINHSSKPIFVRFYQISFYHNDNDLHSIKSFLFKAKNSNGSCILYFDTVEVNSYSLHKDKLNHFINHLKSNSDKSDINKVYKVKYMFYPVYDFTITPPPSGDDINQAVSDLLC
jgi:hypothetical protein